MPEPLFPRYTFKNFLWTCAICAVLMVTCGTIGMINPFAGNAIQNPPLPVHKDLRWDSEKDYPGSERLSDEEYLRMHVDPARRGGYRVTYLSREGSGWLVFNGKPRADLADIYFGREKR